jgi:large subunit ribosomal protein L16
MVANFSNIPFKLKFKKFRKRSTFSTQPELSFNQSIGPNTVILKATSPGRLDASNLEAARKVLRRKLKKTGKVDSHVFPFVSITKKPLAVRMGKGKGAVEAWIFPIRPGRVIFEIKNIPLALGAEALNMAKKKLPIASKVVINNPII